MKFRSKHISPAGIADSGQYVDNDFSVVTVDDAGSIRLVDIRPESRTVPGTRRGNLGNLRRCAMAKDNGLLCSGAAVGLR